MLRFSGTGAFRLLLLLGAAAALCLPGANATAKDKKKKKCPEAYAELSGAGRPAKQKDLIREALLAAEKELGFEPRYEVYTYGVKAFFKGKPIADVDFLFKGKDTLVIDFLSVNEDYRQKGLSRAIVAMALKHHPEIEVMEADALTLTNGDVIRKALAEGLSCFEAMRLTPAFRMRESLGFTELSDVDCEEGAFKATRPKH